MPDQDVFSVIGRLTDQVTLRRIEEAARERRLALAKKGPAFDMTKPGTPIEEARSKDNG